MMMQVFFIRNHISRTIIITPALHRWRCQNIKRNPQCGFAGIDSYTIIIITIDIFDDFPDFFIKDLVGNNFFTIFSLCCPYFFERQPMTTGYCTGQTKFTSNILGDSNFISCFLGFGINMRNILL